MVCNAIHSNTHGMLSSLPPQLKISAIVHMWFKDVVDWREDWEIAEVLNEMSALV